MVQIRLIMSLKEFLRKSAEDNTIMEKYQACKELIYFHLSFIKVYTSGASLQEITILLRCWSPYVNFEP